MGGGGRRRPPQQKRTPLGRVQRGVHMTGSGHISIAVEELRNECFVVMPFDGLFHTQYDNVIRPAIEDAGLVPLRGDELFGKPHVMADVWNAVRSCRAVLAELSGRNANVFYELGLAHAIGKPAIIITRQEADVPFDLRAHRYIFYDINDPFWGDSLKRAISSSLKRLLDQSEFGSGLEGICLGPDITLPRRPSKPVQQPMQEPKPHIGGVWSAKWSHLTEAKRQVSHVAILSIAQDKGGLVVEATISTNDADVLLENMVGQLSHNTLRLRGVAYTFLTTQPANRTYHLDEFELTIVDATRMTGIVMSNAAGDRIPVELTRLSSQGWGPGGHAP